MSDSTALTQLDPLSKPMGFKFVSLGELTKEQVDVLKSSVAKGATDTELTYFLQVAFAQELDPFRKEVWCIKRAKKHKVGDRWDYKRLADGSIDYSDADLVIMTGRDGFLKMAKRDPSFDYIQSAEVREGDHFVFDPITGNVEHRFGVRRGQIVGAYAVITRKDGVKIGKYLTFQEYYDDRSDVWKDNPTAMIVKSVEAVLCKQFANITGITAEETIHREGTFIDSSPVAQDQQISLKDDLIKQIEACTTPEEFAKLRDTIAGSAGKLFGPEKDAVYAAAKAKKAEMEALAPPARPDMTSKVIDHKDGDPKNNEVSNLEVVDGPPADKPESFRSLFRKPAEAAPGIPDDEFTSWLEGVKNQETAVGVDDVLKAASEKPLSEQQRAQLAEAAEAAKSALQPKGKSKKK